MQGFFLFDWEKKTFRNDGASIDRKEDEEMNTETLQKKVEEQVLDSYEAMYRACIHLCEE